MNLGGEKRLYRSEKNKMIAGVAGGIAEYANIDPTLVRIGWVVGTILLAPTIPVSLALYIILAVLVPVQPSGTFETPPIDSTASPLPTDGPSGPPPPADGPTSPPPTDGPSGPPPPST
jgi:phage shock protein C